VVTASAERYGSLYPDAGTQLAVTPRNGYLPLAESRQGAVTPFECGGCQKLIDGVTYFPHAHPRPPLCESCFRQLKLGRGALGGYHEFGYRTLDDVRLPVVRRCEICGRQVAFGGYRQRRYGIFCSDGCERERVNRRRRVSHQPVACVVCDEHFTPARSDARYCSSACRQDAYRKRKLGMEM
jgi:hypothetical protein